MNCLHRHYLCLEHFFLFFQIEPPLIKLFLTFSGFKWTNSRDVIPCCWNREDGVDEVSERLWELLFPWEY